MAKHHGGTQVRFGFYWSPRNWALEMVPAPGGTLPGTADETFVRIPSALFLVVAPLMGACYVIFLPLVGFWLVFSHFGGKALEGAKTAFVKTALAVSPHWAPGEAYLAARRRAKDARRRKADDETLDKLDREISARRDAHRD